MGNIEVCPVSQISKIFTTEVTNHRGVHYVDINVSGNNGLPDSETIARLCKHASAQHDKLCITANVFFDEEAETPYFGQNPHEYVRGCPKISTAYAMYYFDGLLGIDRHEFPEINNQFVDPTLEILKRIPSGMPFTVQGMLNRNNVIHAIVQRYSGPTQLNIPYSAIILR